MGNLLMYIKMYTVAMVTMKLKVTFAVLNIHLLIIPNTPMWIFKLKTPKKNCKHVPYNNKKQIMR